METLVGINGSAVECTSLSPTAPIWQDVLAQAMTGELIAASQESFLLNEAIKTHPDPLLLDFLTGGRPVIWVDETLHGLHQDEGVLWLVGGAVRALAGQAGPPIAHALGLLPILRLPHLQVHQQRRGQRDRRHDPDERAGELNQRKILECAGTQQDVAHNELAEEVPDWGEETLVEVVAQLFQTEHVCFHLLGRGFFVHLESAFPR